MTKNFKFLTSHTHDAFNNPLSLYILQSGYGDDSFSLVKVTQKVRRTSTFERCHHLVHIKTVMGDGVVGVLLLYVQ